MNMSPDYKQFVDVEKAGATSPDWVAANHAAAAAHNAKRSWYRKQDADDLEMTANALDGVRQPIVRFAIAGCYLVFWATAAAMAAGILL